MDMYTMLDGGEQKDVLQFCRGNCCVKKHASHS